MSIISHIKRPNSKVFRRAYIKRRLLATGQHETSWQEITRDVRKWGTYKSEIDSVQPNKFTFSNARITTSSDEGKYNSNELNSSWWYGYAPAARSLIKIEAGYYTETSSGGIWSRTEYPTDPTIFIGVIDGQIAVSNKGDAQITAKSLMQVMRDYPAANLRGFTTSGQTASKVIQAIWDHTDGSGGYIFRPYFGNTSTNWNYSATTIVYDTINTGAAQIVRDITTWDLIERLAECESKAVWIDRLGRFHWEAKDAPSTPSYYFYGNTYDRTYGNTIKEVSDYNVASDKFYSKVSVKFNEDDTITSAVSTELTLTVSGINNAWIYGQKTYAVDNIWIQNTATASIVAASIYAEVSSPKKELAIETVFIPHLNVMEKANVTYSSNQFGSKYIWDARTWADDSEDSVLYWAKDDALDIDDKEFKIISVSMDLDNFDSKFKLREV